MELDLLFFGAHPDDVELCCAGTILKMKRLGYKVGIIDLTCGELGSFDDKAQRLKQAQITANMLKLDTRETLTLPDTAIEDNYQNRLLIAKYIRKLRPKLLILPWFKDRHPDHTTAASLIENACFYAKLKKIKLEDYAPYLPKLLLYYPMHEYIKPTFVVDITEVFPEKLRVIKVYSFLTSDFLFYTESISRAYGALINTKYGEGFWSKYPIKIEDIMILLR
jgi:bacillithiol biosynthesis deacetylase BshB1